MLKLSFLTLLLVSPIINAEEARSANAHVHGLNNLAMVINHNQIAITYEMPIVQLLEEHEGHDDHEEHEGHDDHEEHEGHDDHEEHEGHDDHEEHEGHDEIMASNDSLAEFQNYLQLFAFPKGAKCDLVSFKSRLHSVSTEGGHKDVELSYEFSCNDPSQLNSLIINAFDRFSELETLNFEAVINNKALTKSLKSGDYKVIF